MYKKNKWTIKILLCVVTISLFSLTVSASPARVTVSWDSEPTADEYEIYRSVNGGPYAYLASTGSGITMYHDNDVSLDNKYAYKVSGVSGGVEGLLSAPSNTIKLINHTDISVTWHTGPGSEEYKVYRSVNDGTFDYVATASGISYVDTSITFDNRYEYKVSGVSSVYGEGLQSEKSNTVKVLNIPSAPFIASQFYYDDLGRQFRTEKTIEGVTYTTETSYDDMGRATCLTYPDGSTVHYTYNPSNGAVSKVGSASGAGDYLESLEHNDLGQLVTKTLGNGVTVNYTYDPDNFRLTHVQASGGTGDVQDLEYMYDNSGMVTDIIDHKHAYNWSYEYGHLYRLTGARRGTGTVMRSGTEIYDKTYAYDTVGNITDFDGSPYYYDDPDHVHAVTDDGVNTYTYDTNGNMLAGAGRSFTWDHSNKPTTIVKDGVRVDFVYGPHGERVKKSDSTGKSKIYVGKIYETDQAGNEVCYIIAGGNRIKKKDTGELFFFLSDRLGGTNVITDQLGDEASLQFYRPYGEDDTTGSFEYEPDDHKFTGQEEDVETGLYYYNARYYDPALGRFISPDSVDGQGPNRYSYCANNPVYFTDPTGNILYVYGSSNFINSVVDDLATIAPGISSKTQAYQGETLATISHTGEPDPKHKVGTKLVTDLADAPNEYVLIIEANRALGAHCAPDGKNAKVAYKPGVSLNILTLYVDDQLRVGTGIDTPSYIILGHEMCHARHHVLQGGFSTIGEPNKSDYNMYWATHYFFTDKGLAYENYRSEEFPTVGFYPWVNADDPSENALRREAELNGRASYLDESSYQYFPESELDKMSSLQARLLLLYSKLIWDETNTHQTGTDAQQNVGIHNLNGKPMPAGWKPPAHFHTIP